MNGELETIKEFAAKQLLPAWGSFINNVRTRGEGRGLTYLVKLIKEQRGKGV